MFEICSEFAMISIGEVLLNCIICFLKFDPNHHFCDYILAGQSTVCWVLWMHVEERERESVCKYVLVSMYVSWESEYRIEHCVLSRARRWTGTISSAVRAVEALLVDGFDRAFCGAVPEPALSVAAELLLHHALVHLECLPERRVPHLPHLRTEHEHVHEHVQQHCASKADFYVQTAAKHTLIIVKFGDVFLNSPITLLQLGLLGGTASFFIWPGRIFPQSGGSAKMNNSCSCDEHFRRSAKSTKYIQSRHQLV